MFFFKLNERKAPLFYYASVIACWATIELKAFVDCKAVFNVRPIFFYLEFIDGASHYLFFDEITGRFMYRPFPFDIPYLGLFADDLSPENLALVNSVCQDLCRAMAIVGLRVDWGIPLEKLNQDLESGFSPCNRYPINFENEGFVNDILYRRPGIPCQPPCKKVFLWRDVIIGPPCPVEGTFVRASWGNAFSAPVVYCNCDRPSNIPQGEWKQQCSWLVSCVLDTPASVPAGEISDRPKN